MVLQRCARYCQTLLIKSRDADLAHKAQDWANHLAQIEKMVHSDGSQRPGQGENLFSAWSSPGPYKDPLKNGAVSRYPSLLMHRGISF